MFADRFSFHGWRLHSFQLFLMLVACSGSLALGEVWEPGVTLSSGVPAGLSDGGSEPLAADGTGNWVAAWGWRNSDGSLNRLYVSRSSDDAVSWTVPLIVVESTATLSVLGPSVVTDRHGLWVCAWSCRELPGLGNGTDNDIAFVRSFDNGITWSSPGLVNSTGTSDPTMSDQDLDLATDGQGNWLCTWLSTESDTSGTVVGRYVMFSRSADNAVSWSAPAALDHSVESDSITLRKPVVATDRAGHWAVAWWSVGTATNQSILRLSRSVDAGATWSSPVAILPTPVSQSANGVYVDLAMEAGGNCVAGWHEHGDVLMSRSPDHGMTWTARQVMWDHPYASGELPRIAHDEHGMWRMMWNTYISGHVGDSPASVVSVDGGRSWSQSEFAPFSQVSSPSLEASGTGSWVALSIVNAGVTAFRSVLKAPPIMPGITSVGKLQTNGDSDVGNDMLPDIATDRSGTWVCVWESDDSLDGTIGTDKDILFSRRDSVSAPWSPPQPLFAAASSDTGSDEYPRIGVNSEGTWIVVWMATYGLAGSLGGDYDILYSRSFDGGRTWTQPAAVAADAAIDTARDIQPAIASDNSGTWVIVWSRGGEAVCSRSLDNGSTWSAPQVLWTAPYGYACGHSSIASDLAGGWNASWDYADWPWNARTATARSLDNAASWSSPRVFTGHYWDASNVLYTPRYGWQLVARVHPVSAYGYTYGYHDIVSLCSNDGGASWSEEVSLTGLQTAWDDGHMGFPHGVADVSGRTMVCWGAFRYDGAYGGLVAAWSSVGGTPWSFYKLHSGSFTYQSDDEPSVATDNRGMWTVVWQSRDAQSADWDIRFATIDTGTPAAARGWYLYE